MTIPIIKCIILVIDYLLSAYHVPANVLYVGDKIMRPVDNIPTLMQNLIEILD